MTQADAIIANRYNTSLSDAAEKIYIREISQRD